MTQTLASRSQPLLPMAAGKLSLNQTLLVLALALAVLLPGLFAGQSFLSQHEVLAAQPAREMLTDGHWIVQTYVGVPRYEKPPATSWLIAASMSTFHTEASWAVRLPSILSAVIGVLVIAHLAARWLGSTVGLIAAAMQITTVWLQTQANLAEADIHIVTAVSCAFALFAIANVPHPQGTINTRLVRVGFMASLGLGFLFKGPHPVIFVLLGVLAFIAARRDWKQLRFLLDPWALGVFFAVAAAWPIAALLTQPSIWHFWIREITARGYGANGDRTSMLLYVLNVPLSLLPWALLLVPLAVSAWQRKIAPRPFELFLFAWFVPGMLILQFASFKSTHYAYPMLPPCSIAMAAGLVLWVRGQNSTSAAIPKWLVAIVAAIAGVGAIAATILIRPQLPGIAVVLAAVVAAGLLLSVLLDYRRKLLASIAALLLTVATVIVIANVWLVPAFKASPSREQFAHNVNAAVQPGQTLYLVNFVTDELVWHLRVPMRRIDDLQAFEAMPLQPDGQLVLTRERAIARLQRQYRVEELDRVRQPTRADISGPERLTPILVRLSAGKPAYDAPSGLPATQAATAPATAPAHRPDEPR